MVSIFFHQYIESYILYRGQNGDKRFFSLNIRPSVLFHLSLIFLCPFVFPAHCLDAGFDAPQWKPQLPSLARYGRMDKVPSSSIAYV